MKKRYITPLVLLALVPLLSHCASQQDVQSLDYNLRSVNKKLDDMKANTVNQMQQRQADYSGQIDLLQSDILELRSKLEENSHMNRMLREQNKELQLAIQNLREQQEQQLTAKLAEQDQRIKAIGEAVTAIQQARIKDAERRSKAAARAAEEAMRRARATSTAKTSSEPASSHHLSAANKKIIHSVAETPPAVKAPTSPTKVAKKPVAPEPKSQSVVTAAGADLYAAGQDKYNKGHYKEAYELFSKYIEEKGSSKSTIPARYMMGECLFRQGEYDQAIIEYQQIISNFPGNPEAAKALLRQGDAFEQLSDKETARIIYKKIVASYGSSPEAQKAKERLSSL